MKTYNIKKIFTLGLVFSLIILILVGCSRSSSRAPEGNFESTTMIEDNYGESSTSLEKSDGQEMLAENIETGTDSLAQIEKAEVDLGASDRKIVYTANMDLETDEYDKTFEDIRKILDKNQGYIEGSKNHGASTYSERSAGIQRLRSYEATFRVPKDKYRDFVKEIDELEYTYYFEESSVDLSLSYSDSEMRKKTLETEAERILVLLNQATRMEDIITLEKRLTEIRYEIESTEKNLRNIDASVDYATIYLGLTEVGVFTPSPQANKSLLDRMALGLSKTLASMKVGGENALISLATNLPFVIIIIILALVIVFIFKRANKDGRIKKNLEKSLLPTTGTIKKSLQEERKEFEEKKKIEEKNNSKE